MYCIPVEPAVSRHNHDLTWRDTYRCYYAYTTKPIDEQEGASTLDGRSIPLLCESEDPAHPTHVRVDCRDHLHLTICIDILSIYIVHIIPVTYGSQPGIYAYPCVVIVLASTRVIFSFSFTVPIMEMRAHPACRSTLVIFLLFTNRAQMLWILCAACVCVWCLGTIVLRCTVIRAENNILYIILYTM